MILLTLFLRLDDDLALLARERAEAPVLAPFPATVGGDPGRFEREADPLGEREPRDAGEEAKTCRGKR